MFQSRSFGISKTSQLLIITFLATMLPAMAMAKTVLIETPLGDIEIELLEEHAPNTVANFLSYIESNRFDKTFIHRSVDGFVIQGGGFSFANGSTTAVSNLPEIANEFKISNTRGTVAMARLGGKPDSATGQWFINLADNSDNLDNVDGGFTVFARVIGDGMQVADAINQLPRWDARSALGGSFGDLPLIDFLNTSPIAEANIVFTTVSDQASFVMNAGLNDAWYNPATDGQGFFITVFPDVGVVSLAWFTYDTELPTEDANANLGDAGHRWLTAVGTIEGNTAVMNIDFTAGGLFDDGTVVEHTQPAGSAGTITLSFENCSSGTVDYDIPSIDRQGSIPIQRISPDNVALCEALIEE